LSTLDENHPDVAQRIASEIDTREELARTSKELTSYRSIFGDSSSRETQVLVKELQEKNNELQKLRLLTEQQAQAETSLYAEIDRLSSLWEGLDQQVKKKVFDLSVFEEKLQKTAHDVRVSDRTV
jgi:E3 ubiquitin-protein ligase BRE1